MFGASVHSPVGGQFQPEREDIVLPRTWVHDLVSLFRGRSAHPTSVTFRSHLFEDPPEGPTGRAQAPHGGNGQTHLHLTDMYLSDVGISPYHDAILHDHPESFLPREPQTHTGYDESKEADRAFERWTGLPGRMRLLCYLCTAGVLCCIIVLLFAAFIVVVS